MTDRLALRRQALSVAAAVFPFGIAFGVLCADASFTAVQSGLLSLVVFTGGSQFAAVGVLADGGSAVAAVSAGLLLAVRFVPFGVVMAPVLHGPLHVRAALSHLLIDESMAVGASVENLDDRRYGYVWAGMACWAAWVSGTVLGRVGLSVNESLVSDLGLDATIPAAFVALLWPRLTAPDQRRVAAVGAAVAAALVPVAPPGVPVIAATVGLVAARPAGRDSR